MVNRIRHKLTWSKTPGEPIIEQLQDGCCGSHCAVAAIVDIVKNGFGNSDSLCHRNASHQVLAQSDLPFRSR